MLTVVLCGGKGTRLGFDGQKCMAPVAGRPFLDHKLDNLYGLGHEECLLLTGHRGEQVEEYVGWPADCFFRDAGLGRGLALHEAAVAGALPDWFWLTYGDTLLSYPRAAVEEVHRTTGRPVMTVNETGVDYGAMIVPRDCWDGRPFHEVLESIDPVLFPVSAPWHHINTPEDLAETERFLCASA